MASERRLLPSTEIVALTLVLLLAAALRIYHINQQSLWFDEAFAWNIVIQEDMFPRIAADTHPPLYYLLLRGWIILTGDSALALRYLSALISLMTVAVVVQVAKELVKVSPYPARRVGWLASVPALAALMLALADAEIFLAQETRNYALYSFLASLSMWMYLRWLRKSTSALALAWAVSTAALMYTHYQGLFIPAVQGLHVLLFLRRRKRIEAIGALALSGLLFLPWFVGVTIPQAQNAIDRSLPFSIPSNWETVLHLRDSYLGAQWALILVLMLAGVVSLCSGRTRGSAPISSNLSAAFLVSVWFLLPVGVLFIGNFFASLLTEPKLLVVAPAIALMVAFGLGRLDTLARGLLVAAIVLSGVSSVDYYRPKEPWNLIAAGIMPYAEPSHVALIEVGVGQYPMKYYWERLLPAGTYISTFPFLGDYTMAPTTDWFTYYNGLLPEVLEAAREQRTGAVATAWLVFWSSERATIERLEQAGFVRTMTITHKHMGNHIDLYRYDHLPEEHHTAFESGMVLRAVELDADALRIDLWWSADALFTADYIISAFLLDENGLLVAQYDSPPVMGTRPTRSWQPGEVIYDPRFLEIASGEAELPPGNYDVAVQVYRFTPEGNIEHYPVVDGEDYIIVGRIAR